MKTSARVLFLIAWVFSAAVRLHAVDVPPPPAWPEIKDPAAFIKIAQELIAREVGKNPQLSNERQVSVEETRFGFSDSTEVSVGRTWVLIVFLDLPFIGRGLLINPSAGPLPSGAGVRIEDTTTPEIKRMWVTLNRPDWTHLLGSIDLREFKNLDAKTASSPEAKVTPWPAYPPGDLRAGIAGKVEARITVKPDGTVGEIEADASHAEFKQAVTDALRQWRFIPGVDQEQRIPVATRISLTFLFSIRDE